MFCTHGRTDSVDFVEQSPEKRQCFPGEDVKRPCLKLIGRLLLNFNLKQNTSSPTHLPLDSEAQRCRQGSSHLSGKLLAIKKEPRDINSHRKPTTEGGNKKGTKVEPWRRQDETSEAIEAAVIELSVPGRKGVINLVRRGGRGSPSHTKTKTQRTPEGREMPLIMSQSDLHHLHTSTTGRIRSNYLARSAHPCPHCVPFDV